MMNSGQLMALVRTSLGRRQTETDKMTAVLQPTHLSSMFLGLKGLGSEDYFFKDRAEDMAYILDNFTQNALSAEAARTKPARSCNIARLSTKPNVEAQYSFEEDNRDGGAKIYSVMVDGITKAGCHNGEEQNTALENVDAFDMYILDRWGKVAQEKRLDGSTEEMNKKKGVVRTGKPFLRVAVNQLNSSKNSKIRINSSSSNAPY